VGGGGSTGDGDASFRGCLRVISDIKAQGERVSASFAIIILSEHEATNADGWPCHSNFTSLQVVAGWCCHY
jgi:hypothetical protein